MRLCLVAPTPPPYGGVANWEKIVEKKIIADEGIELSFIDISANKRPLDGRNFFDKYIYSGYVMLRAYLQLKKYVRKQSPDVVHITTSGGMGFFRDLLLLRYLKKKGIPSVYHIHFGRTVKYKTENGRCWRQIRKTVQLADWTITIDRTTQNILKEYANNIVEINNPIDLDSMEEVFDTKENKSVVYLGWVIKAKGIEELIEGFNCFVNENGKEYTLYIVGPGEEAYIRTLKKRAKGNIIFTGELEHLEAMKLLASSQILVLPSYTEGFPNVVLEGMALQKCVIATSVGALPDILSNGAGILIQPKSSKEIKEALDKTTDKDYRQTIANKGYQKVKKEYDIEMTMVKYKNVWIKAMGRLSENLT